MTFRAAHPLQTSCAQGSAGTMLGPRAAEFAVWLNKHHGLTQRKTSRVFNEEFGLSLRPAVCRICSIERPVEILQSLAATATKRGQDFLGNVVAAIRVSSPAPVR